MASHPQEHVKKPYCMRLYVVYKPKGLWPNGYKNYILP